MRASRMGADVEAATLTFGTRVRTIIQRRAVLARLVGGDLKVKYEGSTLGYLWSILEPLLLTLVYFFVFEKIGGFGRRLQVDDFALFLISGILPWQWVTSTVNGSVKALRGNARLITKVYIPREIFPLSVVGAKSIEFALSLLVLPVFALMYRHGPSMFLAAMPLAILMELVLLTGLAMILSAANTLLRDVERVIRPMLRVFFYVSAILYPLQAVFASPIPYWVKVLLRLNPVVGIMELYHAVWYPESFLGWTNVAISALGCVVIFILGWTLFTKLERSILKEL